MGMGWRGDRGSDEEGHASSSDPSIMFDKSGMRGHDESTRQSSRPPKMRQKKYRDSTGDADRGGEDRRGGDSTLMKRRRKAELQIQIGASGSAAMRGMGPPDDTPKKLFKYGAGGNGPLESPLSLDNHVGFDANFSITADTPTLSKLMNLIPPNSTKPLSTLTSDSLKFDFDEVVQHFPSPRGGMGMGINSMGMMMMDPSSTSWANLNCDSTTSVGSFFNFPDPPASTKNSDVESKAASKNAQSSSVSQTTNGSIPLSNSAGDLALMMLMSPRSPKFGSSFASGTAYSSGASYSGSMGGFTPTNNRMSAGSTSLSSQFTPVMSGANGMSISNMSTPSSSKQASHAPSNNASHSTPVPQQVSFESDQGKFGMMKSRGRHTPVNVSVNMQTSSPFVATAGESNASNSNMQNSSN